MTQTPLDRAEDGPQFYNLLAGAELFLLLSEEPAGDQISPDVFATDDGCFVLVFDQEDRLANFVGGPAPFAALTGRSLAEMLEGQGIGVALNPLDVPSSRLLSPATIDWLHQTLRIETQEVGALPVELKKPNVPEQLIASLDTKLASAVGLARAAYLVASRYQDGTNSHILAFLDAQPNAQPALTQAVGEALTFAGLEAAVLDIAFFDASDPMAARLAKSGLRFDLPEPELPLERLAPGTDPDSPPRLR